MNALLRTTLPLALATLTACGGEDKPQTVTNPTTEYGQRALDLYNMILYIDVGIFIVVAAALVYILVRFRAREGDDSLPEQVHGNQSVEIAWTTAPVFILAAIAVPTVRYIWLEQTPPEGEVLNVRVIGKQWWWDIQYPELGVRTANEVHLPVGQDVHLSLLSDNVIHAFWIPRLGGKRDLVPGRVNNIWFTPLEPGRYEGQCAELCGDSHALMRIQGVVHPAEEFEAWVAHEKSDAVKPTDGLAAKGEKTFLTAGCVACHTIRGNPVAQSKIGPELTHVASRPRIASNILDNDPESLRRWIDTPEQVKPGSLMPNLSLSEQQLDELVAYLQILK